MQRDRVVSVAEVCRRESPQGYPLRGLADPYRKRERPQGRQKAAAAWRRPAVHLPLRLSECCGIWGGILAHLLEIRLAGQSDGRKAKPVTKMAHFFAKSRFCESRR